MLGHNCISINRRKTSSNCNGIKRSLKKAKKKKKKNLEANENINTTYQNLWNSTKNCSKREVHNNSGFHQETTTKIPNKQSNFIPKGTRKRINEAHN